ncbi:stressosome-associated protein Prli42 [Paenibacillus sp. MCAF20]
MRMGNRKVIRIVAIILVSAMLLSTLIAGLGSLLY